MIKFSLLFFLFQAVLFASLQDDIEYECPKEYEMYEDDISQYLIRMEDDIKDKGCKVIPIYASIIQSENFEILDALEDDESLMANLTKLFSVNKNLSSVIFKNSGLKQVILNNSINEKFIESFSYLIKKKLHNKQIKQIKKEPEYLNYYLLSSLYAKNNKDSLKLYNKLKSSISIELLPSFTFILSAIGDEYEFSDLLENFAMMQSGLSTDAIKKLAQYPKYFVYFLYPKKDDLGIETISNYKLKEIQKEMQKKVISLYKSMFDKYRYRQGVNQHEYALLSVEYIYPYLLEQHDIDYDDFVLLFNRLIDNDYLISLFTEDKCSEDSKTNFAIFGKNNIYNVSKFMKEESRLSSQLFHNLDNSAHAVFPFFYVANFYNTSSKEEWFLFKDLLKILPYEYNLKIAFLKRIEKNGYFRNIVTQSDYKNSVNAKDSTSYPKYKYILVTPYPSQNDSTLFEQILTTNISDEKLKESLLVLIQKDIDDLAEHEFTQFEKFVGNMETIEKLDDALFIASIVAAPFTGGASLSYIAISVAKKGVQKGAKKGFKYMVKKVALKRRKMVNKAIRKARKGRKLVDDKIGVSNRKKIGKVHRDVEEKVDKLEEKVDVLVGVLSVGAGIYLYFNHSQLEEKSICQEQ